MIEYPIILASTSLRRKELLQQIGVKFEIVPSQASEDIEKELSPREAVHVLAQRKADAIASVRPEALVIAADTVISLDDEILGKPGSYQRAKEMLARLSGRTHQVVSGVAMVCLLRNIHDIFDVTTDVTFGVLSNDLIEKYVKTGEPLDKAGAYAIQGGGSILVQSIKGSYCNVVGFPIFEIAEALSRYTKGYQYLWEVRKP